MAQDDKLIGARNGLALYFAYMNDVAREIGMERAVTLSAYGDESMGAMRGKMIREQAGAAKFDVKAAAKAARESIAEDFGIISKVVDETPNSVVVHCGRCPVYEAARMVGIDAENVETDCCGGAIRYMDALVKQLNPNLSYELRTFRSSADDFCEEAVVMR